MSFSEIVVVVVIGLFVIKSTDVPIIIKKLKEIRFYFDSLKKKMVYSSVSNKEVERINFYLQEIININGDYSLKKLNHKYNKLLKSKINNLND